MSHRRSFYLQAPVGNNIPIVFRRQAEAEAALGFNAITDWRPYWYGSGTMALAAAVRTACKRSDSDYPLVALAAYGCPDLVSAILYAGAKPVFIDLAEGGLGMDLALLSGAIANNSHICAVIGTDLFGIPEKWKELRQISLDAKATLVQDCAQSLQHRTAFPGELNADLVAFSFGRGKPVCLQGGGALLVRKGASIDVFSSLDRIRNFSDESTNRFYLLRSYLYNAMIRPRFYSLLSLMMGDRLGQTRFIPLRKISGLSARDIDIANSSLEIFWRDHMDKSAEVAAVADKLVSEFSDQIQRLLPTKSECPNERIYSRLPLLTKSANIRARMIANLAMSGISATPMYKRILPDIVSEASRPSPDRNYPVARRLADRLITFPVHNRLSNEDIDGIASSLRASLDSDRSNSVAQAL